MIKAGIIGAAGYTGGELIRLLIHHPEVELVLTQSESQAGKKVSDVHPDLYGVCDLSFEKDVQKEVDVFFLCKGHGESKQFLEQQSVHKEVRVIDLSQDFRHPANCTFGKREFIYGLPELHKEKIQTAKNIANPGCFATAIQLALLPLASQGLIKSDVHVSATTGSTGAGQAFSPTSHFSWRSNNHSAYKILSHQHEKEICVSLTSLQKDFSGELFFVPQRGSFARGIHAVCYLSGMKDLESIKTLYQTFYKEQPFTYLVPFEPDVKQVVNTNNCFVSLQEEKGQFIIVSVIDNLLKGASGQAVQNMNLMFGLEETLGLKLKASAF